jgi:type IV pilus assembly protein PilA
MTTLNSRLQLALLNRKKAQNVLQKGFTLVELMIVVVIVGILSGVALPSFLGQASKAKGVECTTAIGSILTRYTSDAAESKTQAKTNAIALATTLTTNSDNCSIGEPAVNGTNGVLSVSATGKAGSDLEGEYFAEACLNIVDGLKDIDTSTEAITTPPTCTV